VKGIYRGQDSKGLQRFEVNSYTAIVQDLSAVQHLNPQVTKNCQGHWEVAVKHTKPAMLDVGQSYFLRLKMEIKHGQLTFTTL